MATMFKNFCLHTEDARANIRYAPSEILERNRVTH